MIGRRTLVALPLALVLTGFGGEPSAAPPSSSAPPPSADGTGSRLEDLALGDEKSPRPTPAEWQKAEPVTLARVSPAASACKAVRMREWLRIRCGKLPTSAFSMLGGERDGLAFWIDPPPDKATNVPGEGEAIFPLRRGDRRVLQIWTFGAGYDGPFTVLPAFVVQEEWVTGKGPIVLVT